MKIGMSKGNKRRVFRVVALAAALGSLMLSGIECGATAQPTAGTLAGGRQITSTEYKLGTGDTVQVTVYGEDDLSGKFDIDGTGNISLPLIGQLPAAGLTVPQLQAAIAAKLAGRFLLNPRVSASVTNYRPFAILGEINKPGEYPYENGMTVLNAVAIGGGFTYRAEERWVYVRHKGSSEEERTPADERSPILPGDTIRVDERLF